MFKLRQTDPKQSRALAEEARKLAHKLHYPAGEPLSLLLLGGTFQVEGAYAQAQVLNRQAWKFAQQNHDPALQACALLNIGEVG